ncbi:helix-turn-helix domain-containing protein [Halovivax sp.]|uniref:winged helix-turn-helix domain-containing protein n=1 Tax=Halovivax sp. TaxID=1935978 RepID=UPI0025C5F29F|nr:helix-turn-helix domain-containing protein [Halovivax sp.]
MRNETPAIIGSDRYTETPDRATIVDDEEVQRVLEVLDDPDCRAILGETGEEPLSAGELADACDVPLSTTYRKLDQLTSAGVLADGLRLCRSGKHTSEYVRRIDDVVVSIDPERGIVLRVALCDPSDRPVESGVGWPASE